MREATRMLPIVTAVVLSFGLAACTNDPQDDVEGAGESSLAQQTDEPRSGESRLELADAERRGERGEERERDERREERDGEEHRERGDGDEHREAGDGEDHGEAGDGEEHSEEHDEEGEESGVQIARDATWDATRNGARLVLSFDAASNAFVGTVENTTAGTLCAVRVEVHLSAGIELGPTERTDVPSGGTTAVTLPTGGRDFTTWTAHPEISSCGGR
mgnify:CR=1 FL=1